MRRQTASPLMRRSSLRLVRRSPESQTAEQILPIQAPQKFPAIQLSWTAPTERKLSGRKSPRSQLRHPERRTRRRCLPLKAALPREREVPALAVPICRHPCKEADLLECLNPARYIGRAVFCHEVPVKRKGRLLRSFMNCGTMRLYCCVDTGFEWAAIRCLGLRPPGLGCQEAQSSPRNGPGTEYPKGGGGFLC